MVSLCIPPVLWNNDDDEEPRCFSVDSDYVMRFFLSKGFGRDIRANTARGTIARGSD